ncbi:MAG: sortase [Ruminococcus sp.]|nr:sortase [Ruminococcus sp.]
MMKNNGGHSGNLMVILGLTMMCSSAALFLNNSFDSRSADKLAGEKLPAVKQLIEERCEGTGEESAADTAEPEEEGEFPETVPSAMIDGYSYDGCLTIPSLNMELPVMDSWTMELLNIAPCRYCGSAKTGDMVIAGHNFASSFGKLRDLNREDDVYFTDMDGVVYHYIVRDIEIVEPDAVDYMVNSDWDLSLYTCTYSGKQRLTVRCEEAENNE